MAEFDTQAPETNQMLSLDGLKNLGQQAVAYLESGYEAVKDSAMRVAATAGAIVLTGGALAAEAHAAPGRADSDEPATELTASTTGTTISEETTSSLTTPWWQTEGQEPTSASAAKSAQKCKPAPKSAKPHIAYVSNHPHKAQLIAMPPSPTAAPYLLLVGDGVAMRTPNKNMTVEVSRTFPGRPTEVSPKYKLKACDPSKIFQGPTFKLASIPLQSPPSPGQREILKVSEYKGKGPNGKDKLVQIGRSISHTLPTSATDKLTGPGGSVQPAGSS